MFYRVTLSCTMYVPRTDRNAEQLEELDWEVNGSIAVGLKLDLWKTHLRDFGSANGCDS